MNDTEHKDFEAHSDCRVYKREVVSENYPFGRVEFIDTAKASGCAKDQLKNVYLLYYDTICITVYNQHPKDNIKLVGELTKKYQTDTTRLADFARLDSSIRITVSRLCKDKADNYHFGQYIDWRDIEFNAQTSFLSKTKDSLITTWYKWTE